MTQIVPADRGPGPISSLPQEPENAPIFIVGCPRSGTTLLYHMLVSSGIFANYRAETHLYDTLLPRFGSLRSLKHRRRFVQQWLGSSYFRRTGLEARPLKQNLISKAHSGGDFLRIVMRSIADSQGRPRWAECTPAHLLYMDQIKQEIPEARFIHIIRDGRDVALSMKRLGWVHALPWDRNRENLVAGWTWEWLVRRGRSSGKSLKEDYREIRFEDLVRQPVDALHRVGDFVGESLDYDRIQRAGVGSVSTPNSAFAQTNSDKFDPIGRWQQLLSPRDLKNFEALVGSTLSDLGYELAYPVADDLEQQFLRIRKILFQAFRSSKQMLKDRTPLPMLLLSPQLASTGLTQD